ncbi:hypothetical protein, partial [Siphonobacter sp. BAB-5405]|uniref:hypothetical protein n=1 Tax=Siphonobacter sp. BAB-5405 TaxID=1864825 RepID=UPI001E3D779A
NAKHQPAKGTVKKGKGSWWDDYEGYTHNRLIRKGKGLVTGAKAKRSIRRNNLFHVITILRFLSV